MRLIYKYFVVAAVLLLGSCNRSSQDYFSRATKLFQEERYDEASINYRRAIQKNPLFAMAYHDLGMCEYAQGRTENALASLSHARQLAPNDLKILEDLADVTYNRFLSSNRPQGLYDSTTALVAQILQANPRSATGLRLKASLEYGDGKIKEAINTYRAADAVSPLDPAIILPLADALRLDNRQAEAEKVALQLMANKPGFAPIYDWLGEIYLSTGRPAEAEKIYKARIQNDPKNASALVALAAFYKNQHKDKEANDVIEAMIARGNDFPTRYLLAGDFYWASQNLAAAERCYKLGITTEPTDKPIYLNKLAYLYTAQNRPDDALKSLNLAIQDQPDDWEAQGMRISVLITSKDAGKLEEGIAAAKAMSLKRPNDGRFPELLGRAYALKGDKPASEKYFQQAAHLDEQFAEPRIALAEISKARRDSQAVLRYTEEVLRLDAKNPHARLLHAWALINQNEFPAAEQEMQSLLEDFPNSYEARLQMGLLYIGEKRTKSAIDMFSKLLESNPGDLRVLAGLATAHFQGYSYDAAIQLVAREVQKNPSSEATRAMLAQIALRLGKLDLALQQFKILADSHPQSAEYQYEVGNLYEYMGDKTAAIRSLEAAVRLMPQDANKVASLALAYYAAGMIQPADAMYSRSLSLSPSDPVLLNNRAYFLAETGNNPDEAMRLAQDALAKSPGNPNILDTLALSYAQKQMGDKAYQILQPLVLNYPNEPMFRYHLAMALVLKGEKNAARKELEGSLAKRPSKDDGVKIRALLTKLE